MIRPSWNAGTGGRVLQLACVEWVGAMPGDPMGFATTAFYFERRAKKERDRELRATLREVAGFYWKLARITPDFPAGYDPGGQQHRPYRTLWELRAEECRAIAECMKDPRCRGQLFCLAEMYDGLAKAAN